MALERLPPELLSKICSYTDVSSVSLVNKRLRDVALRHILCNLAVTFPGDRYEKLSGLLRQSENSKHVRHLVLRACGISDAPWERLVGFLGHLTGLKSLKCHEGFVQWLFPFLHQLPQCELYVSEFFFGGGLSFADYYMAVRLQLLSASRLTSLECDVATQDLEHDTQVFDHDEIEENSEGPNEGLHPAPSEQDEDEDTGSEESDEDAEPQSNDGFLMTKAECSHFIKLVNFLSSIAPNLKRLLLRQIYCYESMKLPLGRIGALGLTHLDLFGLGVLDRLLLQELQKITDFGKLEVLALPRMRRSALAWLDRNPIALPALKQLRMHIVTGCTRERCFGECCQYTERILLRLPPLKKLRLTGDYNHVLCSCLERHSTLQSLSLQEYHMAPDWATVDGIDLDLLKSILCLKSLTSLDIQTRPIRDGTVWTAFRDSRVTKLKLAFEYRRRGDESMAEDVRSLLERAAVDEALATTMFDTCGLEYLKVTNVLTKSFASWIDDAEECIEKSILEELAGSYRVTRAEGRIKVVKLNLGQERPVGAQSSVAEEGACMEAFRSLWPSKGGDWRDDWHSLPLFTDGQ